MRASSFKESICDHYELSPESPTNMKEIQGNRRRAH